MSPVLLSSYDSYPITLNPYSTELLSQDARGSEMNCCNIAKDSQITITHDFLLDGCFNKRAGHEDANGALGSAAVKHVSH